MSNKSKIQRYKHSDGKRLVEVHVKNSMQLFDSRDPAPFRERDLDDDFVQYVTSTVREFSYKTPVKISITVVEKHAKDLTIEAISEAIHSYWVYQIELIERELKTFFKRAQLFMLIGIAMLVTCITVAQSLGTPATPGFKGVLREGIIIFGWVSIWKPMELLLFDWYPLFEKLRLYQKLLKTSVEVK